MPTRHQRSSESQGADSSSYLVRMWREPQTDGEGPVRVYMRNLRTGEELYLGEPKRVGELLEREAEASIRESSPSIESQAQAG